MLWSQQVKGTVWAQERRWGSLKQFGAAWGSLGQCGAAWDYMGQCLGDASLSVACEQGKAEQTGFTWLCRPDIRPQASDFML